MTSSLDAIPERRHVTASAVSAQELEEKEATSEEEEEPVAVERSLSEWWYLEERQRWPASPDPRPVSITEFDGLGNSAQFSLRCERDGCATPRINQDGSIAMDEEVDCGEEEANQESPVRHMHLPGHDRYAMDEWHDRQTVDDGSGEGRAPIYDQEAISTAFNFEHSERRSKPAGEATKERSFWQQVVDVLMPLCADAGAGAGAADVEHGSFVAVPVHLER